MRIRLGVPDGLNRDETKEVLDAALESVTRASVPLIERGQVPTFVQALKTGNVRWRPEPPGDEHFDLPQTVIKRGWGDCDDLAPWHAASLRASGLDPMAEAIVRPSGPGRWHAIVKRGDGRIVDPSRAAGMGSVGADDYTGPLWPSMFGDRLSLATYPMVHGWAARVDVPELEGEIPMVYSHLAGGHSPRHAIIRGIQGADILGRCGHEHQLILSGLHDLLNGADYDEVGEALDHYGVVGFLPFLAPAAASLAAPLLSKILPGSKGGAPAQPAAAPGVSPSMAQTPGSTMACPGGPIIVRF
jgi:hypothetical protein